MWVPLRTINMNNVTRDPLLFDVRYVCALRGAGQDAGSNPASAGIVRTNAGDIQTAILNDGRLRWSGNTLEFKENRYENCLLRVLESGAN